MTILNELLPFNELFLYQDEQSKLWGYKNSEYETHIMPDYKYAGAFSESRAIVNFPDTTNSLFESETFGNYGVIDTTGNIIIPTEYADITNLAENYEAGYIVKNSENKFGIISPDKTKILDTKYDEIKKVSGNGYYVVVENGKTEVVDKSGNIVLNTGFDSIESINIDNFIITKSGKYGVINKSGEELILAEYDNLKFAFSNAFIAQKDGKYGIIDKSGNTRSRI